VTDDLATRPTVGPAVGPTRFDPGDTVRIGSDPDALARFYLAHYDDVVRYLARRLDRPHDVADLVADTFLAALDSAGSYDPARGRPVAWLFGIAHHQLARHHRRRDADRRAAERFAGRRLLDADDIARLEERIDAAHAARAALERLDRLSTVDRELVELVHLHGLEPREAALVVGMRPDRARVRLFRARAKLRAGWQAPEEDR
jgi:RNA polymerase sigma-70 factor (ECF subfamily)